MTDEERRWALADKLRRKGFIVAADELMRMQREIERLTLELAKAQRLCGDMVQSQHHSERLAALAQSAAELHREPDPTKVICPNCTHQFTAISVADQERLRAQSDAEPNDLLQNDLRELLDLAGLPSSAQPRSPHAVFQECLSVLRKRLAQSDAEPVAQKKLEEATTYAEQLAISLAARWYPEISQWKPLRGDLIGLLTQIDNMTTGAVRAQSDAEPVAYRLKDFADGWMLTGSASTASTHKAAGHVVEPLYTAPPRPDASAEIAELQERCAEAQKLAFEWMKRHDKVVGFISKNCPAVMMPNLPFPSPVARPDASAGMSWAGFNVYGDKKSMDAVRDALHAKDRCEALDKMISEKQLVRPDASASQPAY